ncbi:MAG TPA: condensation domain-containing protein, partial [Archangium sp.]|nr:condensation domain-containing protein [Archangium sp.]
MAEIATDSRNEELQQGEAFAFPASHAQARLFFLDRLDPGNAAYHMPFALRLTGPLDVAALERGLSEVYCRHEALRTRFEEVDGEVLQLLYPPEPLTLARVDLSTLPEGE